ncbi:hypothetical protein JIY74_35195 [Vibrio harveyi]|nr:hypothetical protein [Vibrio harveyi]
MNLNDQQMLLAEKQKTTLAEDRRIMPLAEEQKILILQEQKVIANQPLLNNSLRTFR